MPILNDKDRKNIIAVLMRELSNVRESIKLNKLELKDTVNVIDMWIENNMQSFNSALPQAAKDNLTQNQKIRLFVAIIKKRWEVI